MLTASMSVARGEDQCALAHTLREVPEANVQIDRLAGHSEQSVMPCFWAVGCDTFDPFDSALEEDPSVEQILCEREYDTEKFYHVLWADYITDQFKDGLAMECALLHAETTLERWWLRLRFADHDQFNEFRAHLDEHAIEFRLESLDQAAAPHQCTGGITPAQRDALTVAVQEGYFAIPRGATMEDVADTLGVSTQAASERIRRGITQFVETLLISPHIGDDKRR